MFIVGYIQLNLITHKYNNLYYSTLHNQKFFDICIMKEYRTGGKIN